MRPCHRLRSVTRAHCPSRLVTVSVEPRVTQVAGRPAREIHTLERWHATVSYLSGGQLADRALRSGRRPPDFWRWLDSVRSRRDTTWVVASGAGYVLTLLDFWSLLDAGWGTLTSAVLADPPVIVRVKRNGRSIVFVDSRNYWRDAGGSERHRDAATGFCAAGLGVPGEPARDGANVGARALADRVCKTLRWWAREQLGPWAATAAGLAWGAYRHSFAHPTIWLDQNERSSRLARSALFGGRLRLAQRGAYRSAVSVTDVNSLYPAVQADGQYPCRLIAYTEYASPADLRSLVRDFACVAKIELSDSGSPLPTRMGTGISYSTGPGTYTLAGAELETVMDTRAVTAICSCAIYEQADLFGSWVRHLYPKKLLAGALGNTVEYECVKLILNSLWGKFAQRARRWVHDKSAVSEGGYRWWWSLVHDLRRPIRYRSLAGRVEREEIDGETHDSFPAIAACVTANGRALLSRYELSAGRHNVLYTDTDSIHLCGDGFSRVHAQQEISADRLGALRHVYRGSDAYYWGPKHYRVGERWCLGCLSADAVRLGDGTWSQKNLSRLEPSLQSGVYDRVLSTERLIRLPHVDGDESGSARYEITETTETC